MLRASDALLVPLAAMPGLEGFVPSKFFDCAAVGRPLIVSARGEAAELADRAGAALCVAPGNATDLAAAVRRLKEENGLRGRFAGDSRSFGEANSRERGVEAIERLLTRIG